MDEGQHTHSKRGKERERERERERDEQGRWKVRVQSEPGESSVSRLGRKYVNEEWLSKELFVANFSLPTLLFATLSLREREREGAILN